MELRGEVRSTGRAVPRKTFGLTAALEPQLEVGVAARPKGRFARPKKLGLSAAMELKSEAGGTDGRAGAAKELRVGMKGRAGAAMELQAGMAGRAGAVPMEARLRRVRQDVLPMEGHNNLWFRRRRCRWRRACAECARTCYRWRGTMLCGSGWEWVDVWVSKVFFSLT
jgi:hypothetical protein